MVRMGALLCVLGLVGPARAREGTAPVLTLEEVLASVLREAPQLEAARQDAQGAEAEVQAARGGFDPEVRGRATTFPVAPYPYTRLETTVLQPTPLWGASLFGGWRYGAGDIPVYYGNLETNRLGEVRAGLSVPLWRNREVDRRRATLEKAELGARAAALSLQQGRLETARSAAQRYWDWVAAGRRLAIARAVLELAQTRDGQLAERVRRGDLPAFERMENQRVLLQRQAQVVASERQLTQAAIELSLFYRDGAGRPVVPPPERLPAGFPEPVAPEALVGSVRLEEVLARRPDVLRLEVQRAQQETEQRLARNQQAPLVDVTVAAAKDLGAGSPKLARPELELGLTLELPVLNRGATGRARGAEAATARLEAQLRQQRDRAVADVRDALSALEAARERLTLARGEVEVARKLEAGERTRFAAGDSSLLIVNLREQATVEASSREVDALAEYFKAAAALRAALALPLAASGGGNTDGG